MTDMNEPLDDFFDPKEENLIPDSNEKMVATFSHLGIVAGTIVPFGSVLLPLILWLVYKDKSEYVAYHAKEALNFQLTMLIGFVASAILIFVVIGIPLLIVLAIVDLVFCIIAAMRANEGERYRYPYTFRFIK
ncbi:MAG: DUF4870 domain-containing protein [Lewinellaceae bacterium]|nr:DUF4870 domain-containing protein [Lewinellaceae bacterium]